MAIEPITEYEAIDARGPAPIDAQTLRAQWLKCPRRIRALTTVYFVVGAWGGLTGGHFLTSPHSNWITWAITLLILEPVGVTCLAALVYLYWPRSWIGGVLQSALRRAKTATLIIAACVAGLFAWVIVYFVVEFWRLR